MPKDLCAAHDRNAKIQTNPLEQNAPMLTLDQLIAEATALPDAAKTILIDKIEESMIGQIDRDLLSEGVQKAQERMAEIDDGTVQTIPGDIALAQIRQLVQK
jgi:Putative addiction module component